MNGFWRVSLRLLALGIFVCGIIATGAGALYAQQGVSAAGMARSRYKADAGALPLPGEVVVEDIINYHRHRLPLPRAGEAIGLDARWGNEAVGRDGAAILQVGFTTAEADDRNDLRPLNLALVIDKSGSMADADKMTRVKQSLAAFLKQLRPSDTLAIVAFDSRAEVIMPSARFGDGGAARSAVEQLYPGGSTNLHAGLMLGYSEARKNYRAGATNRVILLTDGIANVGVIDPREIARDSAAQNADGVDLSTIGVGFDLDQDLLRTLAKSGRGLYHFAGDTEEIEKVFVSEAQSLMSPVARDVRVEITLDPALELEHIYGYTPQRRGNTLTLNLDDMNSGVTQVIMLRAHPAARGGRVDALPSATHVRLDYFDLARKRRVEQTVTVALKVAGGGRNYSRDAADRADDTVPQDLEVRKNYTIAELAQGMRDMASDIEAKRYAQAENKLSRAVTRARDLYPNMTDADIRRTYDIAAKYLAQLREYNRTRREDCDGCR